MRILSIDDDEMLLLSRDLILRSEGYEAESLTSKQAMASLPDGLFHVAVVGHSVSAARCLRITSALRQINPDIRILRMQEQKAPLDGPYDAGVEALASPCRFVEAVKSLCGRAGAAN